MACDKCLKFDGDMQWEPETSTINGAAWNGHIECLKYFHENGYAWDWSTNIAAVINDHHECLKYLHENGCEWNFGLITIHVAAKYGSIECVKYIHENGCMLSPSTISVAARSGNLDCLRYVYDNGWYPSVESNICTIMFDGCLIHNCNQCVKWTNSFVPSLNTLRQVDIVMGFNIPEQILELLLKFVC